MASALLNIVGGLGMFAFLALMVARGAWVRQGVNRALAISIMLASLGCVMLASSLEQYGSRARGLGYVAWSGFVLAALALVFWLWKSKPRVF